MDRPITEGFYGNLIPGLSDTDTWNVDNPVFWNALRPVLHVANAFFKVSATDPLYVPIGGQLIAAPEAQLC